LYDEEEPLCADKSDVDVRGHASRPTIDEKPGGEYLHRKEKQRQCLFLHAGMNKSTFALQ
jgi:hypothetical protein